MKYFGKSIRLIIFSMALGCMMACSKQNEQAVNNSTEHVIENDMETSEISKADATDGSQENAAETVKSEDTDTIATETVTREETDTTATETVTSKETDTAATEKTEDYWTEWSAWQDEEVTETSTREVETRQADDDTRPIYKTYYRYSRWAEKSDGWGKNGPIKGTWGGVDCQYYIESDWMEQPLDVVNTQYSKQVGGYFNNYGSWYNETTKQELIGYEQKTQYRYRDCVTK